MSDLHLFPEEPVRFTPEMFDKLMLHCVGRETSDVTIQTNSEIRAEIYGKLYRVTKRKIANSEVGDILNHIYGANGTTQIYSGHDVDTHYEIRPNRTDRYRFRVNGTGCQVEAHDGIQITLRTIPTTPPALDSLELEPELLSHIAPLQGTVVVTGPTGSGKSTLLASIIRSLAEDDTAHRKMVTYESPIEFVYDMIEMPSSIVSQAEIPRHLESFAKGVRNALRRKPGLILVGEARDKETIAAVIDAALTGHPVYTTLHSNGVADAVRRMIVSFPPDERNGRALDILETIRLVIWQKLMPSTDGKRVALREYLVFNEEIRDILISTNVELMAAKTRELLKAHGQPIIVDAEKKLKQGKLAQRDFDILAKRAILLDKDLGVEHL